MRRWSWGQKGTAKLELFLSVSVWRSWNLWNWCLQVFMFCFVQKCLASALFYMLAWCVKQPPGIRVGSSISLVLCLPLVVCGCFLSKTENCKYNVLMYFARSYFYFQWLSYSKILGSLFNGVVAFLAYSALVERLCVNKSVLQRSASSWMETRSPDHLNTGVFLQSGLFSVAEMITASTGSCKTVPEVLCVFASQKEVTSYLKTRL